MPAPKRPKDHSEEYPGAAQRRDAVLGRMLKTPANPKAKVAAKKARAKGEKSAK